MKLLNSIWKYTGPQPDDKKPHKVIWEEPGCLITTSLSFSFIGTPAEFQRNFTLISMPEKPTP